MPKQNDRDDYELRDEYDLSQLTVVPKGRYAPERPLAGTKIRPYLARRQG